MSSTTLSLWWTVQSMGRGHGVGGGRQEIPFNLHHGGQTAASREKAGHQDGAFVGVEDMILLLQPTVLQRAPCQCSLFWFWPADFCTPLFVLLGSEDLACSVLYIVLLHGVLSLLLASCGFWGDEWGHVCTHRCHLVLFPVQFLFLASAEIPALFGISSITSHCSHQLFVLNETRHPQLAAQLMSCQYGAGASEAAWCSQPCLWPRCWGGKALG